MKRNIAIVWGGYSSEKVVSEKSASGIYSFMDKERYNVWKVRIDREGWFAEHHGHFLPVNKNDFSILTDEEIVRFDYAYITIHGTPGEDGTLQGYFDMVGIPYSGCGVLASALTFNKYTCNHFLKNFGVGVPESILLRRGDPYSVEEVITLLGLPLFVKPNVGGSSFATTKVKEFPALKDAIAEAFTEATEVIVEQFVAGREVTCGCFASHRGFTMLPLTEVVTHNEFFDYNAKYNGQVEEITPAPLPETLTSIVQQTTERIYRLLGAHGIIRADYILDGTRVVLLEVNTTPGMTPTSFIPQQVTAAGLQMRDLLTDIIESH
ncbi:MAG: D-alanine--D-alanine ligase [Proteiniphilum sp.]|jgi:D-alanine-D-alanine ligase|nr:D-alanine--D-alanine ligase [Proteiniphilum sp.]MDD4459082.1 D-alanine--D-alanine ligase [Proteiniphilum sp.]